MKRILQAAAIALMVFMGTSWSTTATAQPGYDGYGDGDISYQDFYEDLSPYGQWIDYPEYGYVWMPNGINGFRPYETGGHWVWTNDYEWMWVSDYSWGWAPFHYGRWFYDPLYGWMWVPGYEWSPAWVAWRDGGDYYGWAPLRPGFNISINISLGGYNPPIDYWCFAPRRYITSPRIYNYCVDRGRNVTIINNTTIINNYSRRNNVFINGPRRNDAERYAGRINPVRFRDASRPGRSFVRSNEVSVYRPRVRSNDNNRFTPRTFDRYDRNRNNNGVVRNGNNLPNRDDRNSGFGRRNNTTRPQNTDPGNNRERSRNTFDRRNNNQPGSNDRRTSRPNDRGNNEIRQWPNSSNDNNRNFERRDMNNRNRDNNSSAQNRRESRNNSGFERPSRPVEQRPSRQVERQPQGQSRQFGNRGNNGNTNRESRGNNYNNNRGSERRSSGRHG